MVEAQLKTVRHARGFLQQRPFGMHPQVFIYLYTLQRSLSMFDCYYFK